MNFDYQELHGITTEGESDDREPEWAVLVYEFELSNGKKIQLKLECYEDYEMSELEQIEQFQRDVKAVFYIFDNDLSDELEEQGIYPVDYAVVSEEMGNY